MMKNKKIENGKCASLTTLLCILFPFHIVAKPMLEIRENIMFFPIVFKSSNYNYLSRRKVLFFAAPEVLTEFSAAWYLSIVGQAAKATYIRCSVQQFCQSSSRGGGGEGVLPIMAYTGRLRPKGVPFSMLQVYERVRILRVEVYKRVGKSVI